MAAGSVVDRRLLADADGLAVLVLPAELAREEDHRAALGLALDDVDEAAGDGDDVAGADGRAVPVALTAVEHARAGLRANAPEPIAGPRTVGHPGERVEVARCDDAAPRALLGRGDVEERRGRGLRPVGGDGP